MNTEEFLEQEINLLNARISSADLVLTEFADLIDALSLAKSKMDLSKEYMNRNNTVLAYKAMLDSVQQLISINQNMLDRILKLKKVAINSDDANA